VNQDELDAAWSRVVDADGPGYVYSTGQLRSSWQALRSAIPATAGIYYSLKANPHPEIVRLLVQWGADVDVCSLGELQVVLAAGAAAESISYLGPGKTDAELRACVEHRVGTIVVESIAELGRLSAIAEDAGTQMDIVIRVNPSEAATGSRLAMGGRARQFGVDEEQLLELGPDDVHLPGIRVVGFHSYNGTRNLDAQSIVATSERLLEVFERLAARLRVPLLHANLGGGFGVAYHANETMLDLEELTVGLNRVVGAYEKAHPDGQVHFESGRFLVAPSGTYLTRVVDKKQSRGKVFVVCDGGTNHFLGASGGGSPLRRNFPAEVIGRDGHFRSGQTEPVEVAGPLCTPNDILLKNAELPAMEVGDRIAVRLAGAYGASASPLDFLSHDHPFAIFLEED